MYILTKIKTLIHRHFLVVDVVRIPIKAHKVKVKGQLVGPRVIHVQATWLENS